MTDKRLKDYIWDCTNSLTGYCSSVEHAQLAVLMDIRDELKRLNELLHCHNFTRIPHTLRGIDRRLVKHLPLRASRKKS